MARPTTGVALLEKYKGQQQSIRRMQAIIETLSGQKSVIEACAELGICEALFRRDRDTGLQAAIRALDPQKPGRKKRKVSPEAEELAALKAENERLRLELLGAQVRE